MPTPATAELGETDPTLSGPEVTTQQQNLETAQVVSGAVLKLVANKETEEQQLYYQTDHGPLEVKEDWFSKISKSEQRRVNNIRLKDIPEDLVRTFAGDISHAPVMNKEGEREVGIILDRGRQARATLEKEEGISRSERRRLEDEVLEGQKARDVFFLSNLRLVVFKAKTFQGQGLPLSDLIQDGILGLNEAIEKFDFRKGFKFSSYAGNWIQAKIRNGIAYSSRDIRLPRGVHQLYKEMTELIREAELEGRDITAQELAEKTGLNAKDIPNVLAVGKGIRSLDEEYANDQYNPTTRLDSQEDTDAQIGFDDVEIQKDGETLFEAVAAILDEKEFKVLMLKSDFLTGGKGMSHEEIGEIIGLSIHGVGKIIKTIRAKCSHPSTGIMDLLKPRD